MGGEVPRIATRPLLLLCAAVLVLLVATSGGYGYHRDELYFLAAGEHLDWAFPDQGPLTPAIAAAMDAIAPDSLTVLRLPSALFVAALVLVTGLLARELGGGQREQLIAAASVAVGVLFLQVGHLLTTTTFDLLAWVFITLIAVRAVRTGDDRLWLLAGLVLGVALLNKPSPAFLAVGLLAGVAIAGPRRLLRSPWVWGGVGVAVLLFSPFVIWQAANGWPQLEVAESIASGGSNTSEPRWAFLPLQLLLVSPLLAPIWIVGLIALLRDAPFRDLRFLAVAWAVLAFVFIVSGGKPYYLGGFFPLLLAAGAVALDPWLDRGRRAIRRGALAGALTLSAVIGVVIALPILPAADLDPVVAVNPTAGETIGWPELAESVAGVRAGLPDPEGATIFTANYGEAGAIDRYGPELGLPGAFSGHNGYGTWGPPPSGGGAVIAVGFGRQAYVDRFFIDCRVAARIENDDGVDNDEDGLPIWVCDAPREPWPVLEPRLEHLG